jgi:hypothetical protein
LYKWEKAIYNKDNAEKAGDLISKVHHETLNLRIDNRKDFIMKKTAALLAMLTLLSTGALANEKLTLETQGHFAS